MTATKARAFSSILFALLGPNLCVSAARADGAADAVRQVGQRASRAQAGSPREHGASPGVDATSRPHGRREAPAMARRRLRRRRAAGTWAGQQLGSSRYEMSNSNSRS